MSTNDTGLREPVANPAADTSKPTLTPPELRRRKTAKEAEAHAYYDEKTKDGRLMTDEEFARMEQFTAETLQLDRQIQVSERWHHVDGALGNGRVAQPMEPATLPHNDTRNTRNGRHQYKLMKVLRYHMDPRRYPLDGIEAETHDEMNKARREQLLPSAKGVLIPWDLPVDLSASLRYAQRTGMAGENYREMMRTRAELRALDTTAGAGSIPTILDTTMIELLRPRMVTYKLGARVMQDMQGLFAIPRQSAASTFYMVTQGGSVTASNQTIDQVPFSPHTGGVLTQYTRQFLEQTNQDAEMFVREDQIAVVARGVETAALNGQASAGYPMGILQNPQIAVYALGTNGAAPTWTELVSMEGYVSYWNADVGSLAYCTTALMRATYKLILKISGSNFPIYLWNSESPEAPLNGYPCAVTNLLPQNLTKGTASGTLQPLIFGNWEDLVYAFWSGMDTIIDPYTSAPSGAVNIVTLQDFDVNVRHYYSFANCVDQISSVTAPVT